MTFYDPMSCKLRGRKGCHDFSVMSENFNYDVNSEGDQPWDYFGRNDAKAETPVLWPPHGKS